MKTTILSLLAALTAIPLAVAPLAAAPACAQSFLEGLARQTAERVVTKALSGDPVLTGGRTSTRLGDRASAGGGATAYQRYGDWEFKLDRLEVGPDEQWQAVIGVRNAAGHRQGMVASEIKVFLINEDGETLANWGELYKASLQGSSSGLETVPGTLWVEPGDQTRIRLRFDGSRDLKPVKIRIQSTGATAQIRTFDVG
jgi:hypothetical protein